MQDDPRQDRESDILSSILSHLFVRYVYYTSENYVSLPFSYPERLDNADTVEAAPKGLQPHWCCRRSSFRGVKLRGGAPTLRHPSPEELS